MVAWAAVLTVAAPVRAHDFTLTQALVVIKADDTFLVDLRIHLDALALGWPQSVKPAIVVDAARRIPADEWSRMVDDLRDQIHRRVRLRFNGREPTCDLVFPEREAAIVETSAEPTVLGQTARLYGRIPVDAQFLTFGMSRAFPAVSLTIFDERRSTVTTHLLAAGEDCPAYSLVVDDAMAVPTGVDPRPGVFGRYVLLGFEHIIPEGVDHILFVLGLFLISPRLRPLLVQVTAFTIAHSVTLALSMSGVVELPSRLVESLIALSITYVAVENLFIQTVKPWRIALVFSFGLLHGMGFAGVLRELGMPAGRFATALVGFNVGVELGQLSVVLIAFLLVGWFRQTTWYRNGVIRPLSILIAAVGLYWTIQRAVGP